MTWPSRLFFRSSVALFLINKLFSFRNDPLDQKRTSIPFRFSFCLQESRSCQKNPIEAKQSYNIFTQHAIISPINSNPGVSYSLENCLTVWSQQREWMCVCERERKWEEINTPKLEITGWASLHICRIGTITGPNTNEAKCPSSWFLNEVKSFTRQTRHTQLRSLFSS